MTLVIEDKDKVGPDVFDGELCSGRNSSMFYGGAPVTASTNMCYWVRHSKYIEGWDEKDVKNSYCYTSWAIGRYVQLIPTYRPQTFVEVADFIGDYLPPEMQDMEVVVKPSDFRFEAAMLKQYPSVMELHFDFPKAEKAGYADYPRRPWLTWISWLRSAWEFLPVKEKFDEPVDVLYRGFEMQKFSRDIHYPLTWDSLYTGRLSRDDIMLLLKNLKDGYYADGSLLQSQSMKLLKSIDIGSREADPNIHPEPEAAEYEEDDDYGEVDDFDEYGEYEDYDGEDLYPDDGEDYNPDNEPPADYQGRKKPAWLRGGYRENIRPGVYKQDGYIHVEREDWKIEEDFDYDPKCLCGDCGLVRKHRLVRILKGGK